MRPASPVLRPRCVAAVMSGLLGATASRLTIWRIPTTCYPSLSSSGTTKNSYDIGYGTILLT
jgi:hypothetical protein